jgi:hypothetical protein
MGRKNVLKSYKMLDAVNMASTQTSDATSVINLDSASIHVVWSAATGAATITVEARNGEHDSWYTLDFGSAIATSGASGDHQISLFQLPFTDIRIKTTAASAGSLTATITAKVTGA